jgi:hypothetical protein
MSTPYIGATLAVAAAVPAAFTKAGYEALTWIPVNGHQAAPSPGYETNMIEIPDLLSGLTKVAKGASVGRQTEIAVRAIANDTGQAALRTYAAPTYGAEVSIRVIDPQAGSNHIYMSGVMFSLMDNPRDTESFAGFMVTFQQNYPEVRTTAPV